MKSARSYLWAVIFFVLAGCTGQQQEPRVIKLDPGAAVKENREIERQAASRDVAGGLEVSLWASEKLLGDPVGMDIDNQGRAYVTVTHRSSSSEFDIRGHREWIPRSMTWSTVEDRRDFLHGEFAPEKSAENREGLPDHNEDGSHDWRDLAVQQEEIYVVEDSTGDGVAERAHRFNKGFDTREFTDVLGTVYHDVQSGDVFAAVAPDVWRLRDTDGDGLADSKETISSGYAVHIGFSGHGMSGLVKGPDGKIYWGIGDIGSNVVDREGERWANPNQGIIARANPDGSDFEIFARGVRNTHEFDFDKYGNLISVDNDGDHAGESERIVHLIHGSDSGWRTNWQFGKYTDSKNNEYKVWMDEKYFMPRHEGQTAHILPPVALYHSGPSGFAYNPGTALSERWRDHFFMTEFVGSDRSAVHAFKLKPDGTSFDLEETAVVQRGILGTSLDFGPDGALYVADWIEGWSTSGRGRIWKIDTPETAGSDLRRETKRLLGENFSDRSEADLLALIKHEDMRVRRKAQFELVSRGESGYKTLVKATGQTGHRLARIHGIWGIGQLVRKDVVYGKSLIPLLQDGDSEVRAQAAKVIGDEEYEAAAEQLIPLLGDEDPRARMYAAEALGKLQYRPAVGPIIDMLKKNNDEDLYLRQAGAIALSRTGDSESVRALHDNPSRALRIAAVVALKRLGDPGIAQFLQDEDKYIVTDAARAIGDDHLIGEALPDLAALLEKPRFNHEPLTRRVINANLYVGTPGAAARTAEFAARSDIPEEMRVEALRTLGVWSNPSIFDRVTGRYRGKIERDSSIAREAVRPVLARLFSAGEASIRAAAAEMSARLGLQESTAELARFLQDDPSPQVRTAALEALLDLDYPSMNEAARTAVEDPGQDVRMTGLKMIPALSISDEQKVGLIATVLEKGTTEEQQAALGALGQLQNPEAYAVIEDLLMKIANGNLKPEIQLDVILAAEQSESSKLGAMTEQFREPDEDPVEKYSEALYGGDVRRGRNLFYRHDAAQCARCHVVDDYGGEVGPSMNGIGAKLNREQILEALVDPGARIAPGYGTVTFTLADGNTISGIVREETSSTLVLQTAAGNTREVNRENIKSRENAPSSMPPMGTLLSRSELRDIVEFLAGQK